MSFEDGNDNPYTVQLTQVIGPAQGADQFDQPNSGYRFVATVFDITDSGANSISDDAVNNPNDPPGPPWYMYDFL